MKTTIPKNVTHIGTTGSRLGHPDPNRALQIIDVYANSLHRYVIHHGGCVGWDEQIHWACKQLNVSVVVHPGDNPKYQFEFDHEDEHVVNVRSPLPNLERNKVIVDSSEFLLAAPTSLEEQLRSGTWATVRYARKHSKDIVFIDPSHFTSSNFTVEYNSLKEIIKDDR